MKQKSEKVTVLPYPSCSPDPMQSLSFSGLKKCSSARHFQSRQALCLGHHSVP